MGESFKELLICQQQSFKDRALGYAMILLTAISIIAVFFVGPLSLLGTIIFGILSYVFYFSRMSVEYEYSYMDKELTIDRIYNQSNRKTVEVLDLNKMDILAKDNSRHLDSYKNRPVKEKDYSAKTEDSEELSTYIVYYEGRFKYRFSFNEDMFNFIRMSMPHKVKND